MLYFLNENMDELCIFTRPTFCRSYFLNENMDELYFYPADILSVMALLDIACMCLRIRVIFSD